MDFFIPIRNVSIIELESNYSWILDKICHIIFSKNMYNDFAIKTARDILNFINNSKFITYKQIKLIKDLKSKK